MLLASLLPFMMRRASRCHQRKNELGYAGISCCESNAARQIGPNAIKTKRKINMHAVVLYVFPN